MKFCANLQYLKLECFEIEHYNKFKKKPHFHRNFQFKFIKNLFLLQKIHKLPLRDQNETIDSQIFTITWNSSWRSRKCDSGNWIRRKSWVCRDWRQGLRGLRWKIHLHSYPWGLWTKWVSIPNSRVQIYYNEWLKHNLLVWEGWVVAAVVVGTQKPHEIAQ